MISLLMTKARLADFEVYLSDYLDAPREAIPGVKCVCYLRPTGENVDRLCSELQSPHFAEYYVCTHKCCSLSPIIAYAGVDLTGFLKTDHLERLAEADTKCQVLVDLQEFYGDCYAVGPAHFTLNQLSLTGEQLHGWVPRMLKRTAGSLASVLLALKCRPVIRFEGASPMATALAQQVRQVMLAEPGLFDFRHQSTLLIIDRKSDLITPLLIPWTYEAMLHELFTIANGRVAQQHNLSDPTDVFYSENRGISYGHLGQRVQEMVRLYKARTTANAQLASVAEMRRFIAEYAEYRSLAMHVSKHVTLADECKRRVELEQLMEVSEMEQAIACHDSPVSHLHSLAAFFGRSDIEHKHKLRLALLYALRYRRAPSFNFIELIDLLRRASFSAEDISMCDFVLKMAIGEDDHVKHNRRGHIPGIPKEPESVYAQHYPPLIETVDALVRGRLSQSAFPKIDAPLFTESGADAGSKEYVVFMVDGSTYAEAAALERYMAAVPNVRIILGGTCIHNSTSLLDEVRQLTARLVGSSSVLSN